MIDPQVDKAPTYWKQSQPPWRVGEAPLFAEPAGSDVLAIVPERHRRRQTPGEQNFLLRLGAIASKQGDPLAYIPTGATKGTTMAVSGGYRPVRLRQLGGSFFLDEWDVGRPGWEERVSVPAYPGSTLVNLGNRKVLIVGGFSHAKQGLIRAVRHVTLVDMNDYSVLSTQPMSQPRGGCSAFVIGKENVIVVGGVIGDLPTEETVETLTTEIFDKARESWEQGPMLQTPRIGAQIAQLSNGDVLVAGGGNVTEENALESCELYEAKNERWREACPLPTGRSFGSLCGLPTGQALLSGGISRGIEWPDDATATSYLYDLGRDIWTNLPDMNYKRFAPLGSPIGDASVVVMDGIEVMKSHASRPLEVLSLRCK